MSLLAWVLASALVLPQEETVASGNVVVRLPSGWTTDQKPEGLFLTPGDLREDQSYVVIVSPGGKAEGTLAEGLEKSWKEFETRGKINNRAPGRETKTEGGVDGLFSVGILETKEGGRLIISIALFKPADRFEAVIALSAQDAMFAKYSGPLSTLLKNLRFKNIEIPVPTPVYEVYVSASSSRAYTLFKDGSALGSIPGEGLDGFDHVGARRRKEGSWGSYLAREGELRIRIGEEAADLKAQADGTWKAADGTSFLKAETSTGLKLDGTYLIKGKEEQPQLSLVFKPDGAFEDRTVTPPLAGTYEIASNSLKLKAEGHLPRSISLVAFDKASRLLLGGTWFLRLP